MHYFPTQREVRVEELHAAGASPRSCAAAAPGTDWVLRILDYNLQR